MYPQFNHGSKKKEIHDSQPTTSRMALDDDDKKGMYNL